MMQLAKELQKRMDGVGVKGHRVTLKAKRRKQGAKPPGKVKYKMRLLIILLQFIVTNAIS